MSLQREVAEAEKGVFGLFAMLQRKSMKCWCTVMQAVKAEDHLNYHAVSEAGTVITKLLSDVMKQGHASFAVCVVRDMHLISLCIDCVNGAILILFAVRNPHSNCLPKPPKRWSQGGIW